ncbi:vWA domain-containing protein [Roseibaca sp. Y0-43]|uniref:vWA domain-containing protein n=1 Tax=Roseibaca sp. Y0-43 TaxID=2816854 RepID=UPI001D0C0F5E|nr:VWA domain-containing protein [Roseibaca sp. Y0-43]MCC1482089.1 VWA domain-containing protein [Roseibaca sp. Y0-43]
MRLPLALCLALSLPLPLAAQDQTNTILVLDGSGSMWGQIDGVNKITIARDVVAGLLDQFPAGQNLGLTVYGHRTRGDCTDIETVVTPGPDTLGAIRQAVAGINPRGRTPMTDAVIAAAQALRHTEQAATVILVSDGIETCHPDPCAAARALEEAGVNFTAHVVGFDVTDPAALAQMQCMAQETGGTFTTAANASELTEALTRVAVATPDPEPVLVSARFSAVLEQGSTKRGITNGVVFEVLQGDATVMDATQSDAPMAVLASGDYTLQAYWIEGEEQIRQPFTLSDAGDLAVEVVFSQALPPATLDAVASGPAGSTIMVDWTGPNGEGDYLDTAAPGAGAQDYQTFVNTMDGTPATLRLPAQPGEYVIRYVMADGAQVLAERSVTVTPQQEALSAPATAAIGETIMVAWQGGGFAEDYIDVARPGAEPSDYRTFSYVVDGNPLPLTLPLEPGDYLIRYITGQDTSVFASIPITLTDIPTTLDAPASGTAGSVMDVAWQGPGYAGDYLTIATPGDGAVGYVTYAYVEGGSPTQITLPDTPGTYELRYIATGRDGRIMASQSLTVQ